MSYDPKTDRYPYPEYTDQHYIDAVNYNRELFDKDYPYVDNSKGFRFKQSLVHVLLNVIVFPVARIRLGLRIKGKENIKNNKELLQNGAITCSNHIHYWDYISIMRAVRPEHPYVISWAPNITNKSGKLVRLVGGIPIPENDTAASVVFMKTVKGTLDNKGWIQIYAEGSMWEYYYPIRPFKMGIGYIACLTDKPVLPMAFSYRKPNLIRRKIFRQIALLTLTIGEPIVPDDSLPRKERETALVRNCHDAVCHLAGIDPKENIYPPIYDHSRKIDY